MSTIYDMPIDEYQRHPALGSTGLRQFMQSPAHFFGSRDPNRPEDADTEARLLGSLTHCALLEPGKVAERYIAKPEGKEGNFSTREGKAWRDSVPAGLTVIPRVKGVDPIEVAMRMSAAVRSIPDVAAFDETGIKEASIFWVDPETGIECKCRPDNFALVGEDEAVLLDLKSARDASKEGFRRAVDQHRYDIQDAWYSLGFQQAMRRTVSGFVFAAVESAFPHVPAAYMIPEAKREAAAIDVRNALRAFKLCSDRNYWPGYSREIQLLEWRWEHTPWAPPWADFAESA